MDDQDIEVYIHPNPEIRSFLTVQDIFPPRVEVFHPPLVDEDAPRLKGLGTIASQIVRDILSIPGILEIRIKPKEIRIIKTQTTLWEDIQPRVLDAIKRSLRRKGIRLVKKSRKEPE